MNIVGAKLYIAAALAVALALRATIGDTPLDGDAAAYASWALNGIVAGLGVLIGPEAADALKAFVSKLAGKDETTG